MSKIDSLIDDLIEKAINKEIGFLIKSRVRKELAQLVDERMKEIEGSVANSLKELEDVANSAECKISILAKNVKDARNQVEQEARVHCAYITEISNKFKAHINSIDIRKKVVEMNEALSEVEKRYQSIMSLVNIAEPKKRKGKKTNEA